MTDPDKIDTIEKARDLSLVKWRKIRELSNELFGEMESNCGFCFYGKFRSEEDAGLKGGRCELCTVEPRCNLIQETLSEVQDVLTPLIDDTLAFLTEMKVDA